MTTDTDHDSDLWLKRAIRLIERANEELADNPDDSVIGTVEVALEALRVAWGALPSDDLVDYFDYFEAEETDSLDDCICPPALIARGGFRGQCPIHGNVFQIKMNKEK